MCDRFMRRKGGEKEKGEICYCIIRIIYNVVCWLLLLLLLLLSPENFTNIISLDICGFIEDRIRISR